MELFSTDFGQDLPEGADAHALSHNQPHDELISADLNTGLDGNNLLTPEHSQPQSLEEHSAETHFGSTYQYPVDIYSQAEYNHPSGNVYSHYQSPQDSYGSAYQTAYYQSPAPVNANPYQSQQDNYGDAHLPVPTPQQRLVEFFEEKAEKLQQDAEFHLDQANRAQAYADEEQKELDRHDAERYSRYHASQIRAAIGNTSSVSDFSIMRDLVSPSLALNAKFEWEQEAEQERNEARTLKNEAAEALRNARHYARINPAAITEDFVNRLIEQQQ
jgi:hypothetical protein